MKLNIKGLVFVGFAAAVFASAANAAGENDYKTVTSKTYVDTELANKVTKNDAITGATKTKITYDAKGLVTAGADLAASDIPDISATYQLKSERVENLDTPNNTTYPTTKAVADALSTTGNSIGNGQLSIQVGSGTPQTFTANQATGTDTTVNLGSAAGVDTTTDTTLAASGETGKLPTAATVKTYVDGKVGAVVVGDGTLSIQVGSGTPTTFSADEAHGNTVNVNLGSAAGADTTTDTTLAATGETGKLPTAATVKTYVDGKVGATYTGTGLIDVDPTTHVITTTAEANAIETVKVNGTALTIDANKAVDITVPSVDVTIPAPTSGTCGTGAPCALVIENGLVSWEPIQQ